MTTAVRLARSMNHEELFLERYDRLLKWATQLTRPDNELAKDLVQEAFVQFTLSDGDLLSIKNVDNYLFGVVRNTYRSHLRRIARQPYDQLRPFEMDLAENLSNSIDPRRLFHIKDELRAICHYACIRKEKSVTGSILILRFFHGYIPSEIGKLLHSSRNIVDVQLRSARAEVLTSLLHAQHRTGELERRKSSTLSRSEKAGLAPDFLAELRDEIFAVRTGDCFARGYLEKVYLKNTSVTRTTLSHLVSCSGCLDQVNRLLGLPVLSERNVLDVLGRATESPESNSVRLLLQKSVSSVACWLFWFLFASTASEFTGLDQIIS